MGTNKQKNQTVKIYGTILIVVALLAAFSGVAVVGLTCMELSGLTLAHGPSPAHAHPQQTFRASQAQASSAKPTKRAMRLGGLQPSGYDESTP